MKKYIAAFLGFLGFATQSMAVPITVDLSEATTSVTNAGTALIGLAVVMIGLTIVYSYLRKRA